MRRSSEKKSSIRSSKLNYFNFIEKKEDGIAAIATASVVTFAT
jgi:hypothetical protein